MYSDTLLDHFQSPRNAGPVPDANAEAVESNPVCGDRLHLWLQVEGDRILRAGWQAEGCAPALAAASAASELLTGMSLDQARRLESGDIERALGGLPARKRHAAQLVVAAVRSALDRFEP